MLVLQEKLAVREFIAIYRGSNVYLTFFKEKDIIHTYVCVSVCVYIYMYIYVYVVGIDYIF